MQTLSAINALLASAKVASKDTGEVQPGDAQLVPNVLVAASILGELGLSTRQVACVFKKCVGVCGGRALAPVHVRSAHTTIHYPNLHHPPYSIAS